MRHPAACVALALMGLAGPLAAQTPAETIEQGIAAFRRLELDRAADLLTRALENQDLPRATRAQALVYLGAAEFERGRRSDATRVFRELVLLSPAHRLDTLTFLPETVRAFDGVRETWKAVELVVRPGATLTVALIPSSPHLVEAVVLSAAGAPIRTLHEGRISGDTSLTWNGRLADGTRADSGAYTLVVGSGVEPGSLLRHVRLPLTLRHRPVDTLAAPPAPDPGSFLPEQRPGSWLLPLASGLAAGAATVVLPRAFGSDGAGPARFAIGGAIGLAGVIGFVIGRRAEVIPANVAANEAVRNAWRQRADSVTAVNRERRAAPTLLISAGTPEQRDGGWR